MKRVQYLSYPYEEINPVYGNCRGPMRIEPLKQISAGDSCNTYRFTIENHWGTHVDCPAHHFTGGKTVRDYDPGFWVFAHPQVVDLPLDPGQIVLVKDFVNRIDAHTDLLLLKTGWSLNRASELYSTNNPGIAPEVGLWLRREYPVVRALGIDFVSLSSFQNRILGREAHQAFLSPHGQGHPVLIIEDMDMNPDFENLKEVWVVPLQIAVIDSAPCTVIGVFDD